MQVRQFFLALPVTLALMLAGCGGAGGDVAMQTQLAADKMAKPPETSGEKPAKLNTDPFVKLAVESPCAERINHMWVIDQTWVFWYRAGNCADNAYAYRLYKLSPDKEVCAQSDSIMGPQTRCSDPGQLEFFAGLVRNAEQANLGLDISRMVEKVDLGGDPQAWQDLDARLESGIRTEQNLVIKDASTWIDVWTKHAGSEPMPKIDFSREMVIAVFLGERPSGCYKTAVTAISREPGKLTVVRTDSFPGQNSKVLCTTALTAPAHLVATQRTDDPVDFVVKKYEYQ